MTDLPRTTPLTVQSRHVRLDTGALIVQGVNAALITTGLIALLMITFDFPLALRSGAEGYAVITKLAGAVLLALLTAALPLLAARQARAGAYPLPLLILTLLTGLLTFPVGTVCAVVAASTLRRA